MMRRSVSFLAHSSIFPYSLENDHLPPHVGPGLVAVSLELSQGAWPEPNSTSGRYICSPGKKGKGLYSWSHVDGAKSGAHTDHY